MSKGTRVLYARGSDLAENFPVLDVIPPSALGTLRVEYFGNAAMQGAPVATGVESTKRTAWPNAERWPTRRG